MAKSKKRKQRRNVSRGVAHIQSTFNNTIVTITDTAGRHAVHGVGRHRLALRGAESTPYAAQRAAEACAGEGIQVRRQGSRGPGQGPGAGRESAITALQASGLTVKVIEDVTPLPHNGCRGPKKRRV